MKRVGNKLTAAAVRNKGEPGLYSDGFGLNLQVSRFWSVEYPGDNGKARGKSFEKEEKALAYQSDLSSRGIEAQIKPYVTKAWIFRYMLDGVTHKMGLGSIETTTLAKARELAQEPRELLCKGVDPIKHAAAVRTKLKVEAARSMTFKACADAYIEAHKPSWKNAKHADQWFATFNQTKRGTRVYPAATRLINDLPVATVDTDLVVKVLQPLWTKTPESASRIRGRIETVLDWATVSNFRQGDNPARWRGHLDKLLPARSKLSRSHHDAVPYIEMGAFMAKLRQKDGLSVRALEFAVLTAARTGEVVGATWQEIDLQARLWVVPGPRMKSGNEHRVALSERAVAILKAMAREGDYVFPGSRAGNPLSNMAMLELLRGMRGKGATVHGFRSTFKDWASEQTAYPNELTEIALAHAVSDKTEAAYRRGDMMEKRRRLMQDWSDFLDQPAARGDNVVSMRERA